MSRFGADGQAKNGSGLFQRRFVFVHAAVWDKPRSVTERSSHGTLFVTPAQRIYSLNNV
jgi:hypothetical protein